MVAGLAATVAALKREASAGIWRMKRVTDDIYSCIFNPEKKNEEAR
jgi:hypothetical protein